MTAKRGYSEVYDITIGLHSKTVMRINKDPQTRVSADDYTVFASFGHPEKLPSNWRTTRNGPLRAVWSPAKNIVRIEDTMFGFHLDLEFGKGEVTVLPSSVLQIGNYHSEYLEGLLEYIEFLNELVDWLFSLNECQPLRQHRFQVSYQPVESCAGKVTVTASDRHPRPMLSDGPDELPLVPVEVRHRNAKGILQEG